MSEKATWFLPSLLEGSGGHRTILQHADFMQKNGYDVEICLEDFFGCDSAASKAVYDLFGYSFKNIKVGWDKHSKSELYFATVWYSSKFVRDIPGEASKYYFVQDYEAFFNPVNDAYIEAENSYKYGLFPITIGRWLTKSLSENFNSKGGFFDFGADHTIYHPIDNIENKKNKRKSVCFIYQPEKPRRCSDLGVRALKVVKKLYPNVDIYLFGSSLGYDSEDFNNLGLISLEECAELYRSCDVGFCISASNPSRIPFEMMSCGLPVVEIHRENNLYDLPSEAVLLAEPTQESIARAIISLLEDEELAMSMSQAGVSYMKERTLENEMLQFIKIIDANENESFEYSDVKPINDSIPFFDDSYVDIEHSYDGEWGGEPKFNKIKYLARQALPPIIWNGLKYVKGAIK